MSLSTCGRSLSLLRPTLPLPNGIDTEKFAIVLTSTMEGVGMVLESKLVVGLDFGTTFSGFAYALRAHPDNVYTFYDWPMQAEGGGLPYCKTQTSLLYASAADGGSRDPFLLREWGWPAYVNYKSATSASVRCSASDAPLSRSLDVLSLSGGSENPLASKPSHSAESSTALHYLSLFKLHLATKGASPAINTKSEPVRLPPGMTARRAIADFLAQISKFILDEVRNKFGSHISMDDIEWCLTVPAIWDEQAKKAMRECSESAGLVQGPLSKDTGSPHPLKLFIEPEAASVYCQQKLAGHSWKKGDKFLVVDCGGGTVDLVLHEKLGSSPSLKVREVQESSGALCGGSRVDEEFLRFLRRKISCFERFERMYPTIVLAFRQDWERIKYAYAGDMSDADLELPPKLAAMWEDENALPRRCSYDELVITNADMRSIFDPVVNRILQLIEERMVPGLQAIMVVGGFSESPYLMKRIRDTFSSRVSAIVSPPCPGSAVCCGAVTMGIRSDTVVSRILKKTYGIRVAVPFIAGQHPVSSKFEVDSGRVYCRDVFSTYVTKGDEVKFEDCVKGTHRPISETQTGIGIHLFSSDRRNVSYTTDPGVQWEGNFTIECPSQVALGFRPEVEVSMFFGRCDIHVTAIGKNFVSEKKAMVPVKFESHSIF